jgi:hypothetical protein
MQAQSCSSSLSVFGGKNSKESRGAGKAAGAGRALKRGPVSQRASGPGGRLFMTNSEMVRHVLFRNGAPITHRAALGKAVAHEVSGSYSEAY